MSNRAASKDGIRRLKDIGELQTQIDEAELKVAHLKSATKAAKEEFGQLRFYPEQLPAIPCPSSSKGCGSCAELVSVEVGDFCGVCGAPTQGARARGRQGGK